MGRFVQVCVMVFGGQLLLNMIFQSRTTTTTTSSTPATAETPRIETYPPASPPPNKPLYCGVQLPPWIIDDINGPEIFGKEFAIGSDGLSDKHDNGHR